jgi:hypothetical protein
MVGAHHGPSCRGNATASTRTGRTGTDMASGKRLYELLAVSPIAAIAVPREFLNYTYSTYVASMSKQRRMSGKTRCSILDA